MTYQSLLSEVKAGDHTHVDLNTFEDHVAEQPYDQLQKEQIMTAAVKAKLSRAKELMGEGTLEGLLPEQVFAHVQAVCEDPLFAPGKNGEQGKIQLKKQFGESKQKSEEEL